MCCSKCFNSIFMGSGVFGGLGVALYFNQSPSSLLHSPFPKEGSVSCLCVCVWSWEGGGRRGRAGGVHLRPEGICA